MSRSNISRPWSIMRADPSTFGLGALLGAGGLAIINLVNLSAISESWKQTGNLLLVAAVATLAITGVQGILHYLGDTIASRVDVDFEQPAGPETRITELLSRIESRIPGDEAALLRDEDRARLAETMYEQLQGLLQRDFVQGIENRYATAFSVDARLKEIALPMRELHLRLSREVEALGRRANVNLLTGMGLAIAGFGALVWMLANLPDWTDPTRVAITQAMRFSLVLFVEIFAFFFLRLYRNNLDGIKYFQNELTNVQAREVALRTALTLERPDALDRAIDELLRTERNFVIKQGETTVEVERIRNDANHLNTLINVLAGATATKQNER
jgi:hypothetical protein